MTILKGAKTVHSCTQVFNHYYMQANALNFIFTLASFCASPFYEIQHNNNNQINKIRCDYLKVAADDDGKQGITMALWLAINISKQPAADFQI